MLRLAIGHGPGGEVVLHLNGGKIDEAVFKRLAKDMADSKGGPPVLLAADKDVSYQEVIKVIDLLSSLGLKKVSLETRRVRGDGKPAPNPFRIPATFTGAEIIAWVGPEVILAGDVLPDANRTLEKATERAAVQGSRPLTAEEVENLRKSYMARFLDRIIDTKLVIVEGKRKIPKDAWSKIEKQFDSQFDKDYLPKMLESEDCKSLRGARSEAPQSRQLAHATETPVDGKELRQLFRRGENT